MKRITCYFNTKHGYFKTNYLQFLKSPQIGHCNLQGIVCISHIYFYDQKVFYDYETLRKYVDKCISANYSFKKRLIRKLISFLDKL